MNKWTEIILGLVLFIAAVLAWYYNKWGLGTAAIEFFKGGLIWFLILLGLLFIMLGISDLKE